MRPACQYLGTYVNAARLRRCLQCRNPDLYSTLWFGPAGSGCSLSLEDSKFHFMVIEKKYCNLPMESDASAADADGTGCSGEWRGEY